MRSSLSLCKLSTFRIRDDVDATEAMPMESGEGSPGIVSDPGISELVSVAKRATPYIPVCRCRKDWKVDHHFFLVLIRLAKSPRNSPGE